MITIVKIATIVWLSGWAVYALARIGARSERSIFFVILIHYLFCAAPLAFDVLVGPPDLSLAPGYSVVVADEKVNLLYCAYVAACPPIWVLTAGKSKRARLRASSFGARVLYSRRLDVLAFIALFSPPLVAAFSPNASTYLQYYQVLEYIKVSGEFAAHYNYVKLACLAASVAGAFILLRRLSAFRLAAVSVGYALAAFVRAKRFIIVVELLILLYVGWRQGLLRGARIWVAMAGALTLIAAFSMSYQYAFRRAVVGDRPTVYSNVRLDYGRDFSIKYALYHELYRQPPILEYRGQSFLFNVAWFVPRRFWEGKPYPYSLYLTARVLDAPVKDYGWGYTSSILGEAVSNLGWLGMLVGPLSVSFVCRLGDRCEAPIVGVLTVLVAVLLLVVHLPVFMPFALLWAMLVAMHFFQSRVGTHRAFDSRSAPAHDWAEASADG